MSAQFKEMEREMQAQSKQSSLYIHLGLSPPSPSSLQAGRQVAYRCCTVLLRLRDMPESKRKKEFMLQYPVYFNDRYVLTDVVL